MRRTIVLAGVAVAVAIGWPLVQRARRGYSSTRGARVVRFDVRSRLLGRMLRQVLVLPRGGPLLVFLHGRHSPPSSLLSAQYLRFYARALARC
jgi:hypothetical protein